MKRNFERLAVFLGQPQHDYKPSARHYLNLNVEKLKKELRLEERGGRHGAREEPPSDAASCDSIEREVLTAVENYYDQAARTYRDNMESYERRLHGQAIDGLVSEIRVAFANAKANFLAEVQTGKGALQNLRDELLDSERAFQVFRRDHQLDRPAHYPDSQLLHLGILVVILLGESVLNGIMLARGHELGVLGGVGSAFMIALVNVLMLGFGLGGWGLRLSHHRKTAIRVSGILLLLLGCSVVVAFNLLVAHYRDALGGVEPQAAGLEAVRSLRLDPFGVADAQSWFLFVMGCCFAVVGAFDRLKMEDAYPGYGKVARHRQRARDDLEATKADLIAGLQDERDDCVDTAREARQEIDRRIQETQTILAARRGQHQAYEAHCKHLEQVANDLLKTYREANTSLRKTPAPRHFGETWASRKRGAQILVPQEIDMVRMREAARLGSESLEEAVKEVNEEFSKALESYDAISRSAAAEAAHGKNTQDAA